MDFNDYQVQAHKYAEYDHNYYPFASLMIEAAEFSDLITKQALRGDDKGVWPEELMSEAGDVLWNLAECLTQYDVTLNDVANYNLVKLRSRKERGVIRGDGGNR